MIAMIVYRSLRAIRLVESVVSLHNVTVATLVLGLDVASVVVLHFVVKLILTMSLKMYKNYQINFNNLC